MNQEGMSKVITRAKLEDLQRFIVISRSVPVPIWRWLGLEFAWALGGGSENMFLIDDSGFSPRAESSAGVARHYSVRLGKRSTLIGSRLYLPEAWIQNAQRREKVGVPEEQGRQRTESELAWNLIETIEADGVEFRWIGFNVGFGREPASSRRGFGCWFPYVVSEL